MAFRKLSPPLFSAKTRFSQAGLPTRYFHFIAVSRKTDQNALVCDSKPLATFRSHGLPLLLRLRCPIHFKENANANQQGQPR